MILKLGQISVTPFILCLAYSLLLFFDSTRQIALDLKKENNLIELLTFITLFLASLISVRLLMNSRHFQLSRFSISFYSLFSLGVFITAMEEIAWGQWFFGFATPQFIAEINAQNEVTLHNLTALQGHSEYFRVFYGFSGLVGILFTCKHLFNQIAPPFKLLSWFIIIFILALFDLILDFNLDKINSLLTVFTLSKYSGLGWYVNTFNEFVEMLIGITALIYIGERYNSLHKSQL